VPPARTERGLDAHDAGENPAGLYDVGRPVGLFFFFFFFFLSTGRPGALPAAVTLVQGAGLNV
jgi:hypothetical protein